MKLIAHRGNLNGPNPSSENRPIYLINAMLKGYDVEIDLYFQNGEFFFGHDKPQYEADDYFLNNILGKAWFHAKHVEAAIELLSRFPTANVFGHDKDGFVITSKGYIWCHSSANFAGPNSVCVLPEKQKISAEYAIQKFGAICSDVISDYHICRK